MHSERPAVARDDPADSAVTINAQRLSTKDDPDAWRLPLARLERVDLLWQSAERGDHQAPIQFGGRVRWTARPRIRRYDHAMARTCVCVDVRIGADLADDAELGKAREQRLLDGSALADQRQRLGVLEALGEHVDVLGVVVPDRDVVTGGLAEGAERFHHVLIVVEYRDVHVGREQFAELLSRL